MPRRSVSICSGDRSSSHELDPRKHKKSSLVKNSKKSKYHAKDDGVSISASVKDHRKDSKRDKKVTCLSVVVSPKHLLHDGIRYSDQIVKDETSTKPAVDKELHKKKRKHTKLDSSSCKLHKRDGVQSSSVEDLMDTKHKRKRGAESRETCKLSKRASENVKKYQTGVKTNDHVQSHSQGDTKNVKRRSSRDNPRKQPISNHRSPPNLVSTAYSSPCSQSSSRDQSPPPYAGSNGNGKRPFIDSGREKSNSRQRSPKQCKSSTMSYDRIQKSRTRVVTTTGWDDGPPGKHSHSRVSYSKLTKSDSNSEYNKLPKRFDSSGHDTSVVPYHHNHHHHHHDHHGSPQYKSNPKHSHTYYRERSRSTSRNVRSPSRHLDKDYDSSKLSKSKPRSKIHDLEKMDRDSRYSKHYHSSKDRIDENYQCYEAYRGKSGSASPRSSHLSSAHISQRYRSRSSSDSNRHLSIQSNNSLSGGPKSKPESIAHDKRSSIPIPNLPSTRKASRSLSSSPSSEHNQKSSSCKSTQLLYDHLMDLNVDDVSDTELQLIIPQPMFAYSNGAKDMGSDVDRRSETPELTDPTVNADVSTLTAAASSVTAGTTTTTTNSEQQSVADLVVQDNENKPDAGFPLDSLEKLSNQIRQHMSGPEMWDSNDSHNPFDMDGGYQTTQVNPSVVSLAVIKPNLSNSLVEPFPINSLSIPWQDLIESAGKDLSTNNLELNSKDSLICVGSWTESNDWVQTVIPLHKRANGLEVLRMIGISRRYGGDYDLVHQNDDDDDELAKSSNENPSLTNHRMVIESHLKYLPQLAWSNRIACGLLNGHDSDGLSNLVVPMNGLTDSRVRHQKLLFCNW